jgi:hypothetical protein
MVWIGLFFLARVMDLGQVGIWRNSMDLGTMNWYSAAS